MPGQQFGHTNALDGFAQSHVIGQYRPAGPGGKSHTIQLVGQQFGFQQRPAQWMRFRILANFGHRFGHALLEQLVVHVFFRIRINGYRNAQTFKPTDAAYQIFYILDGSVLKRPEEPYNLRSQIIGNQESKFQVTAIIQVIPISLISAGVCLTFLLNFFRTLSKA